MRDSVARLFLWPLYECLIIASLCAFCAFSVVCIPWLRLRRLPEWNVALVAASMVLLFPVPQDALSKDSPHNQCLFSCHHFTLAGGTFLAAAVVSRVASASFQCFVKVNLELSSPPPLLAHVTTLFLQHEALTEIVFAFQRLIFLLLWFYLSF